MIRPSRLAPLVGALALAAASPTGAGAAGLGDYAANAPRAGRAAHVPVGVGAMAPFSYIQFCMANAGDCGRASDARSIEWNGANRALVTKLNGRINRSIRPVNDAVESWRADVSAGDCEDFALTKRRALLQAGLPAGALRMAVATTGEGEWHAVLIVTTSEGDMVLDNRFDAVRRWDRTDLRWSKIASAEDPRVWRVVKR